MSMRSDSLLSNISNISVLIKPGDGSSIFNFSMLQNNFDRQSQRPCEVKIDDIFPFDMQVNDHNSMFDRIVKKEEKDSGIMQFCQVSVGQNCLPQFNEKAWAITQLKGVSQDQRSPEEEEQERSQVAEKKLKNQTKNIPKNYGKAIITFIQKYREVVMQVCKHTGVPFDDFYGQMSEIKKRINTIADLRRLWIDYKYARCMRIISNLFLRKYSLNYIFNSRICNFKSHIKYRQRLREAVRNPHAFRHIKDY